MFEIINKTPVVPNTNGLMMVSQLSHSRSSLKKLRLEQSTVGTDEEEKNELRDCYRIVSGNFSDRRKYVREGVSSVKSSTM